MITREELVSYLAEYLKVHEFIDYCPNGLQVEGADEVKTIVTGVTASKRLIEQAIDLKAQAILVHHGYFWKGEAPCVVGMKKERLKLLLEHNINLLAYHLPLDCHVEIGNNVGLSKLLPVTNVESFDVGSNKNLLWLGEVNGKNEPAALLKYLRGKFNDNTLHLNAHSNKPIKRLAWCSGGAQDYIEQAKILGADAYLSGEVSERTTHSAYELDIHYFACGHHATEKEGIKALGDHIAKTYQLDNYFIDIYNPV